VQLGRREVAVLVTEGRVSVDQTKATSDPGAELPAVSSPSRLAFVDAGSRMLVRVESGSDVTPTSDVQTVPTEELDKLLAWRNPRLEFSGTPLSEAVKLLNQHNRVQFVIADPALNSVRVSGYFRAGNTEAFVRLLEAGFGVKAKRRSENEIILREAR
jgi:transmembrane sensor